MKNKNIHNLSSLCNMGNSENVEEESKFILLVNLI